MGAGDRVSGGHRGGLRGRVPRRQVRRHRSVGEADPPRPSSNSSASACAMTPDEERAELSVIDRIKRVSIWAYFVFAAGVLIFRGFKAFVGLTCSAAVTMISFLWLEEIVTTILQPSPQPSTRRLTLRALARFVLLGVATSVTIFV